MIKAEKFWVNSLGEYGRSEANGADFFCGGSVSREDVDEAGSIEKAFARQRKELCSPEEIDLLVEFDRLYLNTGDWRVYGGIDYTKTPQKKYIHLVTELSWDDKDEPFWQEVQDICTNHGFIMQEMVVHSPDRGLWKSSELPPNFQDMTKEEQYKLSCYTPSETEGMERRQVECFINILGKSIEERDALVSTFSQAIAHMWEKAGVVVI